MSNKNYIILIMLLVVSMVQAKPRGVHVVHEKVGQGYYLNACNSCHGAGKIAGNMATQKEWKALLANKASELIYLHQDVYTGKKDKDATKVIEYLKSKTFTKEHRKLLKFLQEFASDSADIPTCY